MSLSAVSSSSPLSQSLQVWQARAQKIQSEFQQLGQDLQAGNLSQAQADFGTLSKNVWGPMQSNSTLAQAFSALGAALQSGNVSAAQQAYTALQQDVQQAGLGHHHHHHAGGSSETSSSFLGSALSQLLSSLGSALQSGNMSAAKAAYSTLAQDIQQLGLGSGSGTLPIGGTVSLAG